MTVCNEIGQVRDGIQCFTVTADCRTAILTIYSDIDHIVFTVGIQLTVDTDTGKHLSNERYCSIFCFAGFIALEGLVIAVVYVVLLVLSCIFCAFLFVHISSYTNGNFLCA